PQSIWKQFKQPVKVVKLTFQSRRDTVKYVPTKFEVFGSNDANCDKENWVMLAKDDSGEVMALDDTKTILIPTGRASRFTCYGIRVKETGPQTTPKLACVTHIKFYIDSGVDFTSAKGQPQASSHSSDTEPQNAFVH
ncbi:unnamed protein product, partial [Meganyctiphanes norvegica]